MREREHQPGQVPPIRARATQCIASRVEIRNRGRGGDAIEREEDGQGRGEELAEVAGQNGVALVALGWVLEDAQEDVLVDGEPESPCACDERRDDEELVGVVEETGCHGACKCVGVLGIR